MLFTRFIKFVNAITKSEKPALKFLLSIAASDVRSLTGSNFRSIQLCTGIQVRPGITQAGTVRKFTLFKVPDGQEWKVPLLHSLLSVKAGEFTIPFDDDSEEIKEADVVDDILRDICIN